MSSTKGWPLHPSDKRARALNTGTEVYVLPGKAVRTWRARVVRDCPESGLCTVQPCEVGKGWSETPVTLRRELVRTVVVNIEDVSKGQRDARLPAEFGVIHGTGGER